MPDSRPLFLRKLLISEAKIAALDRGKHAPASPHEIDERDLFRQNADRGA